MSWNRTNLLIAAAAERLGATAEALSGRHTDALMRLRWAGRTAVIGKTRSPFLSQVAQTLSNNKFVSRELLAGRGIPTVSGLLVDEGDDPAGPAVRGMIDRYGRVVIKPNWGNRGVGVTTDVRTLAAARRAIARAQAVDADEEAVVEPFVAGTNLRVCVIGGRFAAACEVQRPRLGAGVVRDQVAALNEDPRRGSWQAPGLEPMDRIEPEEDLVEHLRVHGVALDGRLPDGVEVEITGEEAEVIDRTEEVHAGWVRIAVEACGLLGVDVGGVDLRGPIEVFKQGPELAEGTGVLLEVNVRPALHLHALPTQGRARPVFEAFVAYCLQMDGAPAPCAVVRV